MQLHSSIRNLARHEKIRRRRRGAFLTAAASLLCFGLAAAPASAGGEFKDGFEDQLGRLLAVHAFHVGKIALLAGHVSNRHGYDDRRHWSERIVYHDYAGDRHHRDHHGRRQSRIRHADRHYDTNTIEYHFHGSSHRPCYSLHELSVYRDDPRQRRWTRRDERAYHKWLRH